MSVRLAAILATALATDPSAPARSEPQPAFTLQRMVPRGEARTIGFYASLFPDCSTQGPVVIRMLTPPVHGRVTFENAQSFPQYAAGSPLAECNTRKVPGQRMVYQGHEGFEGADSFRILVINADGIGYEADVKVAVR
jgi:hypothetical protein